MSQPVAVSKTGRLFRKPWYAFWKAIAKGFYDGRDYTIQIPQGQRIYTPWYQLNDQTPFAQLYRSLQSAGPMGVSLDRCYLLFQMLHQTLLLPGDFVECGVYKGGTAQLIASVMKAESATNRWLHLFDTFEGMPDSSIPERDYHKPGDFSDTSVARVSHRLSAFTDFCRFYPGFMPDTFAGLSESATYAFVHVDVDIYPSVMACCHYFWPRLSPGGCMIFDDYGFYPYRYAARAAADDYFKTELEKPITLPTGQAMVIKLPQN